MPSGYNKAGPAQNADGDGEVAFSATFIPSFKAGQLVVCGTARCIPPGVAMVQVQYKRQSAPPGTPWTMAGFASAWGPGKVVLGPTTAHVDLNKDETYDFRVVIQSDFTQTTEADDYFSITVLELDQPEN